KSTRPLLPLLAESGGIRAPQMSRSTVTAVLPCILRGLRHGAENMIPDRDAYTEAHVGAGAVVLHVLVTARRNVCILRPAVMESVVHHVINDVTGDEAGKKGREPGWPAEKHVEDKMKQAKEDDCQRDAHHRGHDQAGPTQRLRVVHAMHAEEYPLQLFGLRVEVKQEPVQ